MSSIENKALVNASGEIPFAREPIQLEDGRRLVFLGSPENLSWLVLKAGEVLVSTRLSAPTVSWLEARLGTTTPALEGLQELFAAVINPVDSKINIVGPNPVSSSRLDPLNALEGSFIDEPGDNGRRADTKIILRQKAAAKEKLAPFVRDAVATGQAYAIGSVGDNDVFVIPTTESMLRAITIDGDPASENRRLQKEGPLVDPGTVLVAQRNSDGGFSYFSTSVGKASGTDMPKLPIQVTAAGDPVLTLAKAIENAAPVSQTATRLRMHLMAKLLADATVIYPRIPEFTQPDSFSIDAVREAVVDGLPDAFARYLRSWQREALPKLQEELAEKRIPQTNDVKVREVGELSEPIIEWVLAASGEKGDTQFDRLVVETLSRRALMERERAIKTAGLAYIAKSLPAGETIESLFEAIYSDYFVQLARVSHADLEAFVAERVDLAELIAVRSKKGKYQLNASDIAQDMASLALDRQVRQAGIEHFAVSLLAQEPMQLNKQRVVRRLERARLRYEACITGGADYGKLLLAAVMAMARFGGPDARVYETPHTKAMEQALAEVDYPPYARLAGQIPWRMIEGPFVLRGKERFETFGEAWSIASSIARDLYIGTEYVLEKYGITARNPLALQIHSVAEMVRATADWRMPDFLPRPTRENPGLPRPVMLLRPDFAREVMPDGSINWVATEGEASPGGLGYDVVMAAAIAPEGYQSTIIGNFYRFLQTVDIPSGVDRNRLTIVMTNEWNAYETELKIFLAAFNKQYPDVSVSLVSIEDMAKNPEIEISSGFVFHFAYPWNFIKDPESATDENRAMRAQMAARANELYARQGRDLFIFNDPLSGRIFHGKMDMAIFHLPGFAGVFEALAGRETGQNTRAMGESLLRMTAQTVPLVADSGSDALDAYAANVIEAARTDRKAWVIKKSMDPKGEDDWGARGIVVGAVSTDAEWEKAITTALTGGLPWVLQRVVDNAPYDKPRRSRIAGPVNAESLEQVAFYSRDPQHPFLQIGDLALEASVKARLNTFLLSARGETVATTGTMTVTPSNGAVAQSIHGNTNGGEGVVIWQ